MDIAGIIMQANQIDAPRAPAQSANASAAPGNTSSTTTSSQGQQSTPEGQMVSVSSSVDYIKQSLDAMLVNYPPFFPAGHPQRIALIKGLKGIQEKIKKSTIPADMKKDLSGIKLTDNASDSDISAALNNLIQIKNSFIQNTTGGSGTKQPGSVVNIKI